MKKLLVKQIEVSINIKQEYCNYRFVEIYDDCVICKGEKREREFSFDNYSYICWLPVGFETRFAEIIFVSSSNMSIDTDRLSFSDSNFVETLYFEIAKVFNKHKKKMPYPFG